MRVNPKGVSFSEFLVVCFIICVLGLTLMRILPVYVEHYQIKRVAISLKSTPIKVLRNSPSTVKRVLYQRLMRQLYINGIESITRKNVRIDYSRGKFYLKIQYQAHRSFIANISLLFSFDTIVEIPVHDS